MAAGIHYQAMQYADSGLFGTLWFSPIICVLLYYTGEYEASAECYGYLQTNLIASSFWLKEWPLMNEINNKLIEQLGEDNYQQAVSRGKETSFEDILQSVDFS
jgi:hypothetical protein